MRSKATVTVAPVGLDCKSSEQLSLDSASRLGNSRKCVGKTKMKHARLQCTQWRGEQEMLPWRRITPGGLRGRSVAPDGRLGWEALQLLPFSAAPGPTSMLDELGSRPSIDNWTKNREGAHWMIPPCLERTFPMLG